MRKRIDRRSDVRIGDTVTFSYEGVRYTDTLRIRDGKPSVLSDVGWDRVTFLHGQRDEVDGSGTEEGAAPTRVALDAIQARADGHLMTDPSTGEVWLERDDAASAGDVPTLLEVVRAVLALHTADYVPEYGLICNECSTFETAREWPCPTVRAVTPRIDATRGSSLMPDRTLPSITTSAGTTVTLTTRGLDKIVVLDNPSAPDDARHVEVGRLVGDGQGFQPVPFCRDAMRPEALRAIADLMEASRG